MLGLCSAHHVAANFTPIESVLNFSQLQVLLVLLKLQTPRYHTSILLHPTKKAMILFCLLDS